MSKHTPGPWQVGRGGGCVIASHPVPGITGTDDIEYYGGHLVAESITPDNALLIAAADDLYEIVRRLLEGWDAECGDVEYLIDDARAAIAKATGETP